MSIEVKEIYDWAVSKSKITDAKDREMISKLETIIKSPANGEVAVEKPPKTKRKGRPALYTLEQYIEAGLGKRPMTEVARKLKVSLPTVYSVARANGITSPGRTGLVAPTVNSKNLDYYKQHGIGERLDSDVARDLSITRERVRQIRARFNIPPPDRSTLSVKWKTHLPEIQKLLEEEKTVSEIARALDLSVNEVNYRIRKAGLVIKAKGPRAHHTKEEVVKAFEGAVSIHEAASRLNLKHYSHIFRYIDRYHLRDLGLVPDGRNPKVKAQ